MLVIQFSMASVIFLQFLCLSFSAIFSSAYSYNFSFYNNEDFKQLINIEELGAKILKTLQDDENALTTTVMMIDASSKFITGLGGGNFFDLGHFDECYKIKSGDIYGKYCLGTLPLTVQQQKKFKHLLKRNITETIKPIMIHQQPRLLGVGQYIGMHFAVCIPSSLKAEEIPGFFKYTEDLCYSKKKEPNLSPGAIITIFLFSIFGLIITASTIFDVYLYYTDSESPHELFIAFSVWTNGRKIFTTTKNSDQLLCLNGIRALSMAWVILGHEFETVMNAPLYNIFDVLDFQKDPANMFMLNATLSVDSFFVIEGLVTVYTFLKSRDRGAKFNLVLYYVHRYLRLTPVLVVVALIHLFLVEYLGSGPLWKLVDLNLVEACKTGWWSTFLYITNYVKKGQCVPQTWYLSVDMQLFLLSPIVLLPLAHWPLIGLGLLGFLTVAGIIVPFAVVYATDLGTQFNDSRFVDIYYGQTYARFGTYVIGMVFGYLIYKIKKTGWKLNLPHRQTLLCVTFAWLISLIGLVACVYAGFDQIKQDYHDRWGNSLFLAFDRPCWAISLGLVILLCVCGYGGPVNSFLSWSVFQFIAKLSYSMYLIHAAVIVVRFSSIKTLYKFSTFKVMYEFWSDFICVVFLALVLCLAFESPVIIIEKHLFKREKSEQRNKKNDA